MGERFDIVVIGAGFAGLGLAYEAATHGFRVAVFEAAATVGTETSDNSLRIVHGGFRYLQNGAVGRMRRSAQALAQALEQYPEFIAPLRSLLPLSAVGLKSPLPVWAAQSVYQLLAGVPGPRRGRIVSAAEIDKEVQPLKGRCPHGALQWWDGIVLDPRGLLQRLARDAQALGAVLCCNSPVRSVAVEGARAIVRAEGTPEVEAKLVFNAAGPRIESVEVPGVTRPKRRWCRGFNLVLKPQLYPHCGIAGEGQGRLLFAVPRDSGTAVGTWYLPCHSGAVSTAISQPEVAAALLELQHAYPGFAVRPEDILRIEAGILPLGGYSRTGEPVPLGPEQGLFHGRYVEVVSTKFTTFSTHASELLRRCAPVLAE